MKNFIILFFISFASLISNAKTTDSESKTAFVLAPTITLTSSVATTNQTLCGFYAITNINYSISGEATGATVIGLPSGVSGNYAAGTFTISGTPSSFGVFNYTVTTIGGSPAATASGTITISQSPTATVQVTGSICNGSTLDFALNSNLPGTTYNWVATASNISNSFSLSGNQDNINQVVNLTNPSMNGTITYSIIPTQNGCNGNVINVNIVVNPAPGAPIATPVFPICNGESTNISINTFPMVAGTTIEWEVTNVTNVIGYSNGSGTAPYTIMQPLYNNSTQMGSVTYRARAILNGCGSSYTDYTVPVYPTPSVIANVADSSIDSGQTTNITLSSPVAGTSFSWTTNQNNVSGANSGNGNSIIQTLNLVNTSQSGDATYTIIPNINGCYGVPIDVIISVNNNLSTVYFDKPLFVLSPNPVIDNLTIKGNTIISNATIYNQLGQIVLKKEFNTNETQLDLSSLKTGIYSIMVDSENKQSSYKIIKQ
ncbi:PKD-like domain-containing protein [Flavobacterium enshiense]|uniref:PKD-like domain-containing protein n=1 Tax=Flavobacterium enshiense TaxID=1341165 RepID=UPI00345D1567